MELPGSSFKPIAFPLEHKAVLITLSICNHNILQFFHYNLGTFGHEVESTAVVRFCKVVLLSKPSYREDSKGHLIISQKLKTTVSRFQKSSESKGKELHSDHLRRGRKGFNFNLITVCKVDIILEY